MRFIGILRTLRLRTKCIVAGLGLAIVVFIVLIISSYHIHAQRYTHLGKVKHSYRLIDTAETIYFHFLQAETCINYSPGNSAGRQQLTDLYGKMQEDLTQLQDLVSDRMIQQSNFQELQSLIQERGNMLLKGASTNYPSGSPVLHHLTSSVSTLDTEYAARVHGIVERMKQEEFRVLEECKEGDLGQQDYFLYLNLLTGIVAVVLILFVLGLVLKDEQENRKREKNLMDLNFNKDKFFSIVSHDLRSPSINILKLAEFLQEQHLPEDDRKLITNHLHTSARNLQKLLDNLLSWARLQMGRIEVQFATIDLYTLTHENIAQAADLAAEKDISIKNEVPPHTFAYADEKMCDMVLRNLLQNAIKFTYPSGVVQVKAVNTQAYVELSVRDTGVGMPPEVVDKLFNLGTHFTSKGTANEQGSGLGLILCRELIEKNNGKILVSSQVNQGTTFTVLLPKTAPAA